MGLMRKFIKSDLPDFIANDVRLKILGDYSAMPGDIVGQLEDALAQTAKGSRTLAVALNYGSQQEIARAAAKAAAEGEVTVEAISRHLYTADLPPLDLLIRTSGEIRLSNFLLWQSAYTEMWFTDVLWPDFTPAHLEDALASFAGRERRYGGR
jgi:undecaprenyl diphosphate synthase